jgi:hypothetical protein
MRLFPPFAKVVGAAAGILAISLLVLQPPCGALDPAPANRLIKLKRDEYSYISEHSTLALDDSGELFLVLGPHKKYCKWGGEKEEGQVHLIHTTSDLQGFRKVAFIDEGRLWTLEVRSVKIGSRMVGLEPKMIKLPCLDECTCLCAAARVDRQPETEPVTTSLRIELPARRPQEEAWLHYFHKKICNSPLMVADIIYNNEKIIAVDLVTNVGVANLSVFKDGQEVFRQGPLTVALTRVPGKKELLFLIEQKKSKIVEFPYIVDYVPGRFYWQTERTAGGK